MCFCVYNICVCTNICVCIYCDHTHVSTYMHTNVCVQAYYLCAYKCALYICVYMYYACTYTCLRVYMLISVHVCIHVCAYIKEHFFSLNKEGNSSIVTSWINLEIIMQTGATKIQNNSWTPRGKESMRVSSNLELRSMETSTLYKVPCGLTCWG